MRPESIDHWKRHAQQWSLVRAPLRPCPEDVACARTALERWVPGRGQTAPVVLVLGVTPELCGLSMELSDRLIAVDSSAEMIRAHWPDHARENDMKIYADWREVPLLDKSVDCVLADGSLSALPFPDGYEAVLSELRRLLRPAARCCIRCFVQPDRKETVEEVLEALVRGKIGNFHVLKWRLAMALQADARAGVPVGEVWEAFHGAWEYPSILAERFHWPLAEVSTIEAYRNVETRYTFPTLAEYESAFWTGGFKVVDAVTPSERAGRALPELRSGSGQWE